GAQETPTGPEAPWASTARLQGLDLLHVKRVKLVDLAGLRVLLGVDVEDADQAHHVVAVVRRGRGAFRDVREDALLDLRRAAEAAFLDVVDELEVLDGRAGGPTGKNEPLQLDALAVQRPPAGRNVLDRAGHVIEGEIPQRLQVNGGVILVLVDAAGEGAVQEDVQEPRE